MTQLGPDWVVLFGGAGRQQTVLAMGSAGMAIRAVVVPQTRGAMLDAAVCELQRAGFVVAEVSRTTLAEHLRPFRESNLLSLGFPFIVEPAVFKAHPVALNVHPTRLPQYRGPNTGAYVLINNESLSGSTVHLMEAEVDKGDIVIQSAVEIGPFDTLRSVQRKVYASEPELVLRAIALLVEGKSPIPQNEEEASVYLRKRTPEDSEVDPNRPLIDLFGEIRASDADDFPAFFYHHGHKVCIRLWRPDKPESEWDYI